MTDKAKEIKDLLVNLKEGLDIEEAKARFRDQLGDLSATDLAQAENALIEEGMAIEDLQGLCNVHAAVVDKSFEDKGSSLENAHPLNLFHLENQAFGNHIRHNLQRSAQAYFKENSPRNRSLLIQDLEKLAKISVHYDRKENLFFPFLEELKITSIPQVMWGVDDQIRKKLKDLIHFVGEADQSMESLDEIQALMPDLIQEVQGMISKEEDILSPLLRETLDLAHWVKIAQETHLYPLQLLDSHPDAQREAQDKWIEENKPLAQELEVKTPSQAPVFQGKGSNITLSLHFPSGDLDLQELESIFSSFPMELTFTDKEDRVRYFSHHENMVFPRPQSALGRDVLLCHPPKAQPIVKKLLEDFRSGRKDQEVRWLKKGDLLILIRYLAVRDQEGHYLGCLELVENLTAIPGIGDHLG